MSDEMPHDLEAERSVIASILLDNTVYHEISDWLQPEDFYRRSHGIVYECLRDLIAGRREPADCTSVMGWLTDRGKKELIGGITGLSSLIDAYAIPSNITTYAKRVRELSRIRQSISLLLDAAAQCRHAEVGNGQIDEILLQTEEKLLQLTGKPWERQIEPIGVVARRELDNLVARLKRGDEVSGIRSGFTDLDELTQGFQPGDMIVLAARPSMGKTSLALEMTLYMIGALKLRVAFFSLEMSREAIVSRLVCMWAQLSNRVWRESSIKPEDLKEIQKAVDILSRTNLYIDDTAGLSVGEIRSRLMRLRGRDGLDIVFIDYMQMLREAGRHENRQVEISHISRKLKTLASEFQIPVVALAQLSRAPELREDHRPKLSDLRDSGSIEQDADLVMFIFREAVYYPERSDEGKTELILAKNRNGRTGTVEVLFQPAIMRFFNLWRDE